MIMPICDNHNFIFVHIPKNAGTTIEKTYGLTKMCGHHRWSSYLTHYPDKWETYHSFAIVRNPYDRAVSSYRYARKKISYWHNAAHPQKARYGKHPDYETLKNASFEDAVDMIPTLKHQGWNSQHHYICDKNLDMKVDRVIRMEKLSEQLSQLCAEWNIPFKKLPVINASQIDKNWEDYYTPKLKQKVLDIYQSDFELFGYVK